MHSREVFIRGKLKREFKRMSLLSVLGFTDFVRRLGFDVHSLWPVRVMTYNFADEGEQELCQ